MGLTSLHVCMDSSDWFQGTIQEEAAMMDSSSSSPLTISGDILTCPTRVPLMDNQRRLLRPQHEQPQKCPRCDSTHTKFCYYNNYSLSQPRYFCKACRRYWTKGGTLRNIPVGGGCRKNKKVSSKKPNDQNHLGRSSSSISNPTHLQLSFPDDNNAEFSQLNNMMGRHYEDNLGNLNFIDPTKYNNYSDNSFMGNKYGLSLLGNGEMGMMNGGVVNDMQYCQGLPSNFQDLSQFGMSSSFEVNNGYHQRLMLPYDHSGQDNGTLEVKPSPKLLTLDWHDQTCLPADHYHAASGGQEDNNAVGYLGGLESSWLMNNHGYRS
ncbi:hypothetical protein Leryth_014979 [Lithospermum erythrorhizon]|uniref:Dof zinc finger protein n=1 Tax=Lithospermum erythrorhizon TaxID=34254 RepID=A0AAV3PJL7_LITER|nr:hypothetical protein Leryth_014979 [Lithospermum erythrorhizon]